MSLTVKNFMCYRDNVPTLELEGIHVACLSGQNGHGKTALLDAITWVLWGQSRARTQEELVHQGQQDMAVELEFIARAQRYRVSRGYSRSARSKQGTTLFELQVVSDDGLRPITGNTVRETEAQIREMLHMDYDTFVNTAFLLQGRADLFTTSSPAMRKERLAEVLDLSYYQRLEQRARDQSRALEDKVREVESDIALRRQEVAGKAEHEQKLASVDAELDLISPEADSKGREVESLREAVDSLRGRREVLDTLIRRLGPAGAEIGDLERQARNIQQRIGVYEASQEREPEIRQRYPQLQEAGAELERLDQALARKSVLDGERARLEQEIAVQTERLSARVTQLRSTISRDLEPRAGRVPQIEESLRDTLREQGSLDDLERQLRTQRETSQGLSVAIANLDETKSGLMNGMEETRKKFDMLNVDGALCPLCKQPLGPEGQEHLRREYEAQGVDAKRQYKESSDQRELLKQQNEGLVAQISAQESRLNQGRKQTQSRIGSLERERQDSEGAHAELQRANSELDQTQGLLANQDFALPERRRLAQLDGELSALGYDADGHRSARERVEMLAPFAELHRKLSEATEALPGEREALATVLKMLDRRNSELELDEAQRKALDRELESLPALESRLAEAQSSHRTLEKRRQDALVQKGVLTDQLARLASLQKELQGLERRRRELVDEKGISDELVVAFGKNGIQALIIEMAIPQLQNEANELLGRLTDNRMFLKLQLQEGRKVRGMGVPSEELEIKISDEVGTRSYETFSGGEAFRINFALRIAMSKLLARRSGAPLPILFIDEGFGTQDSTGQERLKEAIQSIQSDFQKIIVITHIDEVKEAFPTRIEVTKTSSGSTFVVV